MSQAKVEKVEIDDLHDRSLDSSADCEYLGMVDEGSYSSTEYRSQLVSQPFLDSIDNSSSYNFEDISGSVTYKIIPMTGEETGQAETPSPPHVDTTEFFVISNPAEVFGVPTVSKKAIPRDPLQAKAVSTTKKRDERRRATHNEVERRRRDKINNWITKLGALIPNSGLPDCSSKGGILAKACDHIVELTERQKRLEKIEVENEKLLLEVVRLNQELAEVHQENASLRNQLVDNCIVNHRPKGQKS